MTTRTKLILSGLALVLVSYIAGYREGDEQGRKAQKELDTMFPTCAMSANMTNLLFDTIDRSSLSHDVGMELLLQYEHNTRCLLTHAPAAPKK